jgi:hypothetical protein
LLKIYSTEYRTLTRQTKKFQRATGEKTIHDLVPHEFEADWTTTEDLLSKVKKYRDWVTRDKQIGSNQQHFEYMQRYIAETDQGNAEARVRSFHFLKN